MQKAATTHVGGEYDNSMPEYDDDIGQRELRFGLALLAMTSSP